MDSLRLTRAQRLKTPADFRRVYASKQWGGSEHYTFNVNVMQNQRVLETKLEQSQPEYKTVQASLGVAVSKKVSKNAVDRNRIKRQIKEFYRLQQNQLNHEHGAVELVITAKPSCLAATDQQRYKSLHELWAKVLKWQRWHLDQSDKHSTTKTAINN